MIRGTWLDVSFSLNVESDTPHLIGIWLDQFANRIFLRLSVVKSQYMYNKFISVRGLCQINNQLAILFADEMIYEV